MKIVQLGGGVVPVPPGDEPDGIEDYIYQLSHHLGKIGCQVCVIDIKGGDYQHEKRGESLASFYELWHLPLPHRYTFSLLQRFINYLLLLSHQLLFALLSSLTLIKMFSKEKILVIHSHISLSAIAAVVVGKLRKNTTVVVYSTHTPILMRNLTWRRRLIDFSEFIALRWADHIVADTPAVKRRLVSNLNLDPARITPIYVGAALDEVKQFLTGKKTACHQSKIVLCVSKVLPTKNQLSAVKAIPQVVAVCPEVKFVFAGPIYDVKYFNSIKRFIAESNLSQWVDFRGEVTKQELYNLYSEAIIFLFPTTSESRGDVLSEAMAFGVPVIATTIEPIADLVRQKEGSAILVDPYDVDGMAQAILHLLQNSSLRQSMSHRGRELVQSFSWEHIAAETLALYNELVQNK
ncbi:glycosyltransferase family 4 protein [Chloroflexota bacterium]